MAPNNQQNDKNPDGVTQNPATERQQRPGTNPDQPANADYDYRPDFGESGGAVKHNPELNDETVQKPAPKTNKPEKQ